MATASERNYIDERPLPAFSPESLLR